MINQVRELFEKHTVPSFGLNITTDRNANGEYINSTLEDHWQTFQEGFEFGLQYVKKMIDDKIEQSK